MDLGSLELQIFVSLTVVLGAAFVALVCDYLKGNNEQLREHNIELRVRKEEQERQLLLDPAGYLAQQQLKPAVAPVQMPVAARVPVAAQDVMRSHAAPADLAAAEARADALQNRTQDRSDVADVPNMAPKRSRRSRRYADAQPKPLGESFGDWVRPEVIARVARKADATASYQSDIREEIAAPKEEARPQPLNAADKWDIRDKIAPHPKPAEPQPVVEAPEPVVQQTPPVEAVELQKEIERVAKIERVAAPAPNPGVVLRPLVIPSLSLEEELERLADTEETPLAKSGPMHSALLEQVIAASSGRTEPVAEAIAAIEPDAVIVEPAIEASPVPVVADDFTSLAADAIPEPVVESPVFVEALPEPGAVQPLEPVFVETLAEPVAVEPPEPVFVETLPEPVAELPVFVEALPEPVAVEALEPVLAEPVAELPVFVEALPEPVAVEPLEPVLAEPVAELPVFVEALPEPVAVEALEPVFVETLAEPVAELPVFVEALPEPVAVEAPEPVFVETLAEPVAELPVFVEALPEPVAVEALEPVFVETLPEPVAELPVSVEALPEPVVVEAAAAVEALEPVFAETVPEPAAVEALEPVFAHVEFAEEIPEQVAELVGPPIQGPVSTFGLVATPSSLAGLGVPSAAEPVAPHVSVEIPASITAPESDPVLSPFAEEPEFLAFAGEVETVELLPAYAELTPTEIDLLPAEQELPVEVASFASETLAESVQEAAPEPPPIWSEPSAPIDISSLRQPETIAQGPLADIELPAGMFDAAMWTRLLTLPNPICGILFTITLTKAEAVAAADAAKKAKEIEDLTPALEKLMTSFVRGTDFGSRIGENEWVFVYSHDATGLNQRRVGGISEKLWDFQLRHLGMSSVSFKWGAVEVQSERLGDALEAARERMNQGPRRRSKLPGSDYAGPRQVVNA